MHRIVPAHEDYRLKPLSYFSNFLVILLVVYGIATAASVGVFLIALGVWFPTTVLTSSWMRA
jgi:hypothetical protein